MTNSPTTPSSPSQAAAAPPTPTAAAADSLAGLMRFLRLLQYRKLYVLTAIFVVSLFGVVYYATATRIYEATASLMVSQSGNDVWNARMTPTAGRQSLIPTFEKLFFSEVVLEGAIASLSKMPPEARIDLAPAPRDEWPDLLRENLSANAVRSTNIIELRYRSKSSRAAEAVMRAIVDSYLAYIRKNHRDVSTQIVTLLEQERAEIEQKILQKNQELLAARQNVRALGIKEGSMVVHPVVQRVLTLNQKRTETQQQRLNLQALNNVLTQAIQKGADLRQYLLEIEPVVGKEMLSNALGLNPQFADVLGVVERKLIDDRAKLATFLQHYGPRHPEVIKLQNSIANSEQYVQQYQNNVNRRINNPNDPKLGQTMLAMVQEKLAKTWEFERQLGKQYDTLEAEAVRMNGNLAAVAVLERDLERLNGLNDALLDRIANIDISRNRSDVRVNEVSHPKASDAPVSPRMFMVAFVCVFLGTVAGALIVYIMDLLDDRFRSPEELRDQLGVPVLAMVRKLAPIAEAGVQAIQVHVSPEGVESESFRTLRTTLAFAGSDLHRLAITSTEPSDGKTTVISNLATAYAQAGKRTLLIDADLRRPGLSKLFEVRRAKGLSEVLRRDQDIDAMCRERILETGIDDLHLLPCGPKPPDPAELLSGARMSDLIAWAETEYDQVLIDCPPVLAASDAAIVGRLTDGMIMVVQPEKNHRRLVMRAVESLLSLQINLVGIVANRISTEKDGGYYGYGGGYGYGYGYGYGAGYGIEEEDDEHVFAEEAQEDAYEEAYDEDAHDGGQRPRESAPTGGRRIRIRRAA